MQRTEHLHTTHLQCMADMHPPLTELPVGEAHVVAVGCLRVGPHQQEAEVAVRYRRRVAGHSPGRVLPRHADGTVADVTAQVCPAGAVVRALGGPQQVRQGLKQVHQGEMECTSCGAPARPSAAVHRAGGACPAVPASSHPLTCSTQLRRKSVDASCLSV